MDEKANNPMAVLPVNRLMLKMGIPMILSMVMQALYNIVDSYFVSGIADTAQVTGLGEKALTALTLAFPVQMLIVAVGIGTGVGTNALLARSLGQGDREKAGRIAGNTFFLGGILYAAFLLFGLFGVRGYIATQTEDPVVLQMGLEYLQICCVASMGMVSFAVFEKLLQATGRSQLSTIAQISGALVNIIFDPILIYGWLGVPEMGIRGAAGATVLGQIVSALLAFFFHLRYNLEVTIRPADLKPDGRLISGIYQIGVPAIIAQALMSVMTYGLNLILMGMSPNAVTAYGLYYKIQQFILFAAFGLRDAITPIVSFAYGMGSRDRIRAGIRYGMRYTLVIMLAGLIGLELLASPLSSAFALSGYTMQLCTLATRLASLSFLFAGINIAAQGVLQALGCGLRSLVLSLCRQLIFVLPVAWLFARTAAADTLVWLTFLIAEGATALLTAVMLRQVYQTKIDLLH